MFASRVMMRAMPERMIAGLLPFVLVSAIASTLAAEGTAKRWFKGNTHAHTTESDGDSTPDEVASWYRRHGYDFLVLSDHNVLTGIEGLAALEGADGSFLLIRGEEVSDVFGKKPIHINGLGLERLVPPQGGTSVSSVIQRNVDAVRGARGVPHINHPNFGWAISAEDLARVERYRLLEIFNGHPLVNNDGGGESPSVEAVWDMLLSAGKVVYGIAVDDAHHFKRPWDRGAVQPGRGWVVVRAAKLEAAAILEAMERGDFYASTGVVIDDLVVDDSSMTITITTKGDTRYTTSFIGRNGAILSRSSSNRASYSFRGDEGYVRAKIHDSNGNVAWLQPVFVRNAAEP
ncbi:MAG TPA: CehA/McbA family metallohydrolase [Thermoanaerobaculia bacterium]|nr:CehA/McbA family metallohydrolase [Thermoanaerobaculia bacterium]